MMEVAESKLYLRIDFGTGHSSTTRCIPAAVENVVDILRPWGQEGR